MAINRPQWSRWLRRTPLHPQWLLGKRTVPPELLACRGRVADVGSANRWLQKHLSNDVDYLAIDLLSDDGEVYGDHPDVFSSAEALPFANNVFDAIACFEVLEHVENPQLAISEAVRVLKPSGIYVLSIPFLYPLHDRPKDFRRCTPFGLHRALTTAGLEVIAIRPMLGSIEVAGLLAALAVAGGMTVSTWRSILVPLAVPLIFAINLVAWLGSRVWPNWDGMAMAYEVVARKQ